VKEVAAHSPTPGKRKRGGQESINSRVKASREEKERQRASDQVGEEKRRRSNP